MLSDSLKRNIFVVNLMMEILEIHENLEIFWLNHGILVNVNAFDCILCIHIFFKILYHKYETVVYFENCILQLI